MGFFIVLSQNLIYKYAEHSQRFFKDGVKIIIGRVFLKKGLLESIYFYTECFIVWIT